MDIFSRDDYLGFGGGLTIAFGSQVFHDQRSYYNAMEKYTNESVKKVENDSGIPVEKIFPFFLRSSFIISLMSSFEHYLNNVCLDVEKIFRTPISHRDIKGGSIKRADIFLTKIVKLEAPDKKLWDKVQKAQKLRNLLVHNGGMLETAADQREVQGLARILPGIEYTIDSGFDIKPELCLYYLDLIDGFHTELSNSLKVLSSRAIKFETKDSSR